MNFPDQNNWSAEDYRTLLREANKGAFTPEHWCCVTACESGLAAAPNSGPYARNKDAGARGLNQMMPSTLKNLGYIAGDPTYDASSGEYNDVPTSAQVQWSGKYFADWRKRYQLAAWDSPGDLYLCNFWPVALRHKDELDYVLFTADAKPTTYKQNPGFDRQQSDETWVDTKGLLVGRTSDKYETTENGRRYKRKGFVNIQDVHLAIVRGLSLRAYRNACTSLNALRQEAVNAALPRREPLVCDGVVGPASRAAIKAFRYEAGLPLVGGFDAQTDMALFGI